MCICVWDRQTEREREKLIAYHHVRHWSLFMSDSGAEMSPQHHTAASRRDERKVKVADEQLRREGWGGGWNVSGVWQNNVLSLGTARGRGGHARSRLCWRRNISANISCTNDRRADERARAEEYLEGLPSSAPTLPPIRSPNEARLACRGDPPVLRHWRCPWCWKYLVAQQRTFHLAVGCIFISKWSKMEFKTLERWAVLTRSPCRTLFSAGCTVQHLRPAVCPVFLEEAKKESQEVRLRVKTEESTAASDWLWISGCTHVPVYILLERF